ncbi:hypothetical protein BST61_g8728 [Cercospora zeina]
MDRKRCTATSQARNWMAVDASADPSNHRRKEMTYRKLDSGDVLDTFDFDSFLNDSNRMPPRGSQDSDLREEVPQPPLPWKKDVPDNSIGKHEIGTEIAIRQLYRKNSTEPWKPWKAGEDPDITKHPESLKNALVVRRERLSELDEGLSLHSVTVQSPVLRALLSTVFEGYRGVSTTTADLTSRAPFQDFVYRWAQYEATRATIASESSEDLVFKLFTSVIEPGVRPLLDRKQDILRDGQAEFKNVWLAFSPDIEICVNVEGEYLVYNFSSSTYTSAREDPALSISAQNIGYNGIQFGWERDCLFITAYDGLKALCELEVVPLRLHPQEKEIIESTKARGRAFVSLQGWH